MLKLLTIAFLAGVLVVAGFSAFAFDLPDYGSKNFSPSGDTPTYFANETAPVSARIADTSARDWSAVDAAAPVPSMAVSAPSQANTGRHGRSASAQKSGKYAFGKSRTVGHSTRSAKANTAKATRTASLHAPAAPARTASKRPEWAGVGVKSGTASAARATTAKHGKAGARAALTHPAEMRGRTPLPEA